jgi:hypothetical protein
VGISTLSQRIGSSAVIVVGIAGVVGVLVALLAMAEGYGQTLRNSGSLDTAIVMRGASANEVSSSLSREDLCRSSRRPASPATPGVSPSSRPRPWWRPTCRSRAARPATKAAPRCAASAKPLSRAA